MSEDSASIIKTIIREASEGQGYDCQEILETLYSYIEDGALTGLQPRRIKQMSDEILANIRKRRGIHED